MPIFFGVMLVPLWKGAKPALPWLVAGLVSLIVHALVPGYLFIIAGALAGVIAGMLIE
jgi:predicted branched-subunit amino acid permease